ncbi:PCNA-interacting partner [Aplochiton taeniatus]
MKDRLRTLIRIFRREGHRIRESERTTIHGGDEMLMVLQLAIAEVNKQMNGEFSVALSDVLLAWKYLLLDKLHLTLHTTLCPDNYELIKKAYESFLKRTNSVDLIDIHSMYKELKVHSDPEDPLSTVQLFHFLLGEEDDNEASEMKPLNESNESSVPCTPSSRSRPHKSKVKKVVRRVVHSYMGLLVNSKNDLAVAHTLNTPNRALGCTAFTDLKHAALEKDTSLFLAVTSFVRAIQLGGKGFAPAESDPLRKHVKGLADYVHFLDTLEELLGENPNPSVAGARLVTSVRAALVKGRSNGDVVYAAVDETAKDLKEQISEIHLSQKQVSYRMGISPARPKAHAVNHGTALGGRETVKVLMALLDEQALAAPGRNKADVLAEDQAVLTGAEETCLLTLFRSPEAPSGLSPNPFANRIQARQNLPKPKAREGAIQSQFACTYRDEEPPLNRVLKFCTTSQIPTCVHPAPKQTTAQADDEDWESKSTSAVESLGAAMDSTTQFACRKQRVPIHGGLLGLRSGNAPGRGATLGSRNRMKGQAGGKYGKRKSDDNQPCNLENQPPQKKPTTSVPLKLSLNKAPRKKNLIAGQGKLTSYFRL